MNGKLFNPRLIVIFSTILAAAFFRLIPHWPNFTPIAAMALFGGAYIGRKYIAFLIPLAALLLSDLIIGFHSNMIAVYMSFVLIVAIGFFLRKNIKVTTVITASLGSSILFFLITNFAAWLASPFYPANFAGLMQSYVAGLAFFNDGSYGISFFLNEVFGTLFYSGVLFGSFYFVTKKFPALVKA